MEKLSLAKMDCIVFVFCAATAIASPAQSYTILATFNGGDGSQPNGLVQGTDGNFYGTTQAGGDQSAGTVFKVTAAGTLTTLHTFGVLPDGGVPYAGLVQGTDGNFYGTATVGGAYEDAPCDSNFVGCGTVFKITPAGTLTTLYSFCSQPNCADGTGPFAGLVQGTDGNFYGTASYGGNHNLSPCYPAGCGTVFRITPAGQLTTLHTFDSYDGAEPSQLVQATDGNFYGTTLYTVFKITPGGKLTTIYNFCSQPNCADGNLPAGLVQGTDGNFYGTTTLGGAGAVPACSQYSGVGCGTVFKVTAAGKETVLHSFDFYHGGNPGAGLVEATDGNFYGTTTSGGLLNGGTIFKITPTGELTTLHSFGALTNSGLVQATNGKLYGTTYSGGGYGAGSIFSLAVGLGWFVKTLPNFGKEGETIHISGPNLEGATEVTFNGTPAEFAVVSSSEITTTVPAGAKTGTVEVRTPPTGPLKSNPILRVVPQITGFTPTSGAVGTTVAITGKELTQTTEVTFDGVKATLVTVDSDTTVTADVPTGANTGKIAITTPGGTATDATSFTVAP